MINRVPTRLLFGICVFTVVGFSLSFGKPPSGKCIVCHNPKNPHEISIPCKQVSKYLANHPGDYAGPCQVASGEKPAK